MIPGPTRDATRLGVTVFKGHVADLQVTHQMFELRHWHADVRVQAAGRGADLMIQPQSYDVYAQDAGGIRGRLDPTVHKRDSAGD